MLTKTDYVAFVQCPLAFWLQKYRPEAGAAPDPGAQRRLQAGIQVDRLAREQFPDGQLIPYRPHPEAMAPLTAQAIAGGASALFQATFVAGDLLVKTDILLREGEGWHLIEVKSSTAVKKEHLPDIAFQYYVLRQAGLTVTRASVMHINNQCRYPFLDDLFVAEDVTNEVIEWLPLVAGGVGEMRRLAAAAAEPQVPIGRHCRDCTFHDHCWKGIDGLTIYHIPHLNAEKEAQLAAAGVLYVEEVPDEFPLTDRQRKFVRFHARREINIDARAIRRELTDLQYPLFFFDFETIDHAVPVYHGCNPYQQVPFQYSLHILHRDGTLTHREYLHTTADDPRPALLEALLNDIRPGGHVIAYHAPFEKGVLQELALHYPAASAQLDNIVNRLWDQLLIFKHHYRHHGFGSSNSLKSVLPVVVPELSYKVLSVQNGSQAQVVWEEMITAGDSTEKEQLAADLRAYCELDTLAMVRMHHVLAHL
jgi:hypothetical protein